MARHYRQVQVEFGRYAKRHVEILNTGKRQRMNLLQIARHSQVGVHDHGNVPVYSMLATFPTCGDEGRLNRLVEGLEGCDEGGFVKDSESSSNCHLCHYSHALSSSASPPYLFPRLNFFHPSPFFLLSLPILPSHIISLPSSFTFVFAVATTPLTFFAFAAGPSSFSRSLFLIILCLPTIPRFHIEQR